MAKLVVAGAILQCSFGAAPCPLVVLPTNRVLCTTPAATIMDNKPLVNIATFGMCSTPSNPQVAAATAAAQGVLTPQPCIPNIIAPWIPGAPTTLIGKLPALTDDCKLMCNWGGCISINFAGQATTSIG